MKNILTNKKIILIIIIVLAIVVAIIFVGLPEFMNYFKNNNLKKNQVQVVPPNESAILSEQKIKEQIIELDKIRKEMNVPTSTPKLIQKQINELDEIRRQMIKK